MMQKLLSVSISGKRASLLLSIAAIAMLSVASCTKIGPAENANVKFIGTWNGTSMCYFSNSTDTSRGTATQYIGAGADGNTLSVGAWFGENACYKAVSVLATVNDRNFSIAAQQFNDLCGNSYLTGGVASLSTAGTLTMTTYITDVINTTTCVFTGTK